MPCILGVQLPEGARALADRLSVQPYRVSERGDPVGRTGRVYDYAYLSFDVSDADFDQLPQQFADAAAFLRAHEADVRALAEAGEAVLDFGHEPRTTSSGYVAVVQSNRLPRDLVRLAAALDVTIELTLYLPGDEDSAVALERCAV